MLTKEQLDALVDSIAAQYRQAERDMVVSLCERIKRIGEVGKHDLAALKLLTDASEELAALEAAMERTDASAAVGIAALLALMSATRHNATQPAYEAAGRIFVPYAEHEPLKAIVRKASRETAERVTQLTANRGFYSPRSVKLRLDDTPVWRPWSAAYQSHIDYAASQVMLGADDFNSVMHKTVQRLADGGLSDAFDDNGITKVKYPSGTTRRLDSSVRQAVNDALSRLVQEQSAREGAEFGSDGVEIDWHSGSRPEHMWFQGRQFSNQEFHRSVEHHLYDYGCRHYSMPIMMDVSVANYTPEQLDRMNAEEMVKHDYGNGSYTTYEATQRQRRFESELRKHKDRAVAFEKAGDHEAALLEKARVTTINQQYVAFSKQMGLPTQPERAAVARYTRGAGVKKLAAQSELEYNKAVDYIRSQIKDGSQKLNIIKSKQLEHIKGDKYIEGKSYIFGGLDDAQRLVDRYAGTGTFAKTRAGAFTKREVVRADKPIGIAVSGGAEYQTNSFKIHYRKTGTHIVPRKETEP